MSSHNPTSPVPAYEANPPQLLEMHSAAPLVQDTAVYKSATGQQQSGTTHHNYIQNPAVVSENNYPPQHVSQLAPPVQQPQETASGNAEYYIHEKNPQQQQLYPQQQLPQQQYQQTYQTAVALGNLEEAAAPVDCPVCRHRALTIVEKVSGNTVHLWAALACVFFCLGCVPYLIPGLKDVKHKCGHCGVLLAEWHKSGRTVVLQHA